MVNVALVSLMGLMLVGGCTVDEVLEDRDDDQQDVADNDNPEDGLAQDLQLPAPRGVQVPADGASMWLYFTDVRQGQDLNIIAETIRLIDSVPPGGTIRAAIHSLSINQIAAALEAAASPARGVDVRVVEDGKDEFHDDNSGRKLAAVLGSKHAWCGDRVAEDANHGCITKHDSGIMHTKLFTFSSALDPNDQMRNNVVWIGSANMTLATGANSFNNVVTVYGDTELYNKSVEYFDDLVGFNKRDALANNDYSNTSTGRGVIATKNMRVWASPEADGDIIERRLAEIAPGPNCEIRVAQAMMYDSRLNLVDQLLRLKRGRCTVKVLAGAKGFKDGARKKLLGATGIAVKTARTHDKYILVDAKFNGSTERRKIVFTGSHNWTGSANKRNDELFIKLEGAEVYDAYVQHFERGWSIGDAP